MAEVDLDREHPLQSLVFQKKEVVVEGDRLHLRISLLHAYERSLDVPDGDRQDLLKDVLPDFPVPKAQDNSFAAFTRDDEVSLKVTQSPTFVDFQGSFVDHALVLQALAIGPLPSSFSERFPPVNLDLSSIWTSDISPHGRAGDVQESFFDVPQSPRDLFRLLVIHEMTLDERAEVRIGGDFLAFLPFSSHADV